MVTLAPAVRSAILAPRRSVISEPLPIGSWFRLLPLLALLLAVGCQREADAPAEPLAPLPAARCAALERSEPARKRNLVLILSDTLRRDRVGLYDGPAATPRMDAFARGGVVFTAAESQAPWTKPSIATLFTGLSPSAHGVISHPTLRGGRIGPARGVVESDVLSEDFATLAEGLAAVGYRTAAFVGNPWLQRRLGFSQGFGLWDDSFAANETPGEVVSEAGLRWLRELPDDGRPYFLYLHYMDAHSPYHGVGGDALQGRAEVLAADPRAVSEAVRSAIDQRARDERGRALSDQGVEPNLAVMELVYDQGVAHFDRAFGVFLDGFAGIAGSDDAAVIVTSDHGEALYERGWGSHGHGLFEDETGVPLLARMPGVAGPAVVSCAAGLIDLRRTLCDYVGASCPGRDQGVSFFEPAFANPERSVVIEGVIDRPRNRALRDGRFKLLVEPDGRRHGPTPGGGFSLYDLEADPEERSDLLTSGAHEGSRAAFRRLREEASAWAAGPRATAERTRLDEATRERLRALGYLDED